MREAGVEVDVLDDPAFERQNEQFLHHMQHRDSPFVHLKLATTLDGRIAAAGGDSRWVTGEAREAAGPRAQGRGRGGPGRGEHGARRTTRMLTARDLPAPPPRITRVVLDPHLTIEPGEQAREDRRRGSRRRLRCGDRAGWPWRASWRHAGVEVVAAPTLSEEGLDLRFVLDELGRRGIRGLLVEGGGETADAFCQEAARRQADPVLRAEAPRLRGRAHDRGAPRNEGGRVAAVLGLGRGEGRRGRRRDAVPGSPERRNVFTGLVEEVGRVSSLEEGEMLRLRHLRRAGSSEDTRAGDSVSVNGACLTVGEARR